MEEQKQEITNLGTAVSVLVQAVQMAQQKGVYTLKDSAVVYEAVNFIEKLTKAAEGPQGPQSVAVEKDNEEITGKEDKK